MTSIAVRCQAKEKFAELRDTISSLQSELHDAQTQGAATQAEQVQAAAAEAEELRMRTASPCIPARTQPPCVRRTGAQNWRTELAAHTDVCKHVP
jgi:hypothetical protein